MVHQRDFLQLFLLITSTLTTDSNSDRSLNRPEIELTPIDKTYSNTSKPSSKLRATLPDVEETVKPTFGCKLEWYPYFALIDREPSVKGTDFKNEKCVGTFLAPTIVLTSAYCCENMEIIGVYAGFQETSNTWMQYTPAGSKHIHPNFKNGSFAFDACVIQLKSELVIGAEAEIMEITPRDYVEGQGVFLLGYGTNRTGSIYHLSDGETMLCMRATVLTPDECSLRMEEGGIDIIGYDSNLMMCAETAERRTGQVMDLDSGGPVIADKHQIGIASVAVKPRKSSKTLSFFTKIDAVFDFVQTGLRSANSATVRLSCTKLLLLMSLYVGCNRWQ